MVGAYSKVGTYLNKYGKHICLHVHLCLSAILIFWVQCFKFVAFFTFSFIDKHFVLSSVRTCSQ